jgi:hypothetical protein
MSSERSSSTGTRRQTLVFTTSTERGYRRLASFIEGTQGLFAVPIPRNVCQALLEGRGLPELDIPGGYIRLWQPILRLLGRLEGRIHCYAGVMDPAEVRSRFAEIASLLIKADVYDRIDPEEWITAFKREVKPIQAIGDFVVVDNYVDAYLELSRNKDADYITLDEIVPTPFDLLTLISLNELPLRLLQPIVRFAVVFFNEYLLKSPTITRAYRMLKRDEEYRVFLGENNIRIIR